MTSTNTGFMKLVFVTLKNRGQTGRFEQLVKECTEKLTEFIKKELSIEIRLEAPVQVRNTEEFCQLDCLVFVTSQPLWVVLLPLGRKLATYINEFAENESGNDLQFRASVQVWDRNFFDIGELVGADLQVQVRNVFFGNLIRHDTFITHYIVDDNPGNGWYGNAKIMQYYFGDQSELEIDHDYTIFADFEHDRRRLTLGFPVLWPEKRSSGPAQKTEGVAKLMISYGSIRRVFCDFDTSDGNSIKLYLHLKNPPLISILFFRERHRRENLRFIVGNRYTHWLPPDSQEEAISEGVRAVADSPYILIKFAKDNFQTCIHILGRFFAANQKPIEIRQISFYNSKFYQNYLDSPLANEQLRRVLFYKGEEDFAPIYMLDALFSRGAHVKDQLLIEKEHRSKFIQLMICLYREHRLLLLKSLERLLNAADENLDMFPLPEMLERCIEKERLSLESDTYKELIDEGYIRLRKVTITPMRRIYETPELIMGNRVLRADPKNFPPKRFLRVTFRDEDCCRIQPNVGAQFIENFVKRSLEEGITVANRYFPIEGKGKDRRFNYLGSSNSQMREQGCYFIEADDIEIQKFRESLGAFKKESVPKLMARFGQCFTQSYVLNKNLNRTRYNYMVEYTGSVNLQGKEYTYSDGVGCMSRSFAREIAKELNLGDFVPSCIQSRFRGFKGVHAVNPNIDALNQWAERRGIDESHQKEANRNYYIDLLFRNSQCKFRATQENQCYEVVKLSAPSPVALNRPMINILDQVSAMQSYTCHQRVTSRIFELLDRQLQNIARTIVEETAARNRLGEFPRIVLFDVLRNVNLTQEPFFRALLRMAARCTLKKLRTKLQISIPSNFGRSMLGVIDETGILQYGQVYIRYTVNMQQKRPGPTAARRTITGTVLVTKNPMIVAGDVRMFNAINVPALEHMCDVIVFPRHGPRPHPDEMAGSDLDGDEYSVIWDPGLYLEHNEPAFDYTPEKTNPTPVKESQLRKQMADFFVKYVSNNSIGKLAIAFLVNSDIYGIESEVCNNVAKKHAQAVDFPKTGESPKYLAKSDIKNDKPSEDPPRKPDFIEQIYKPTYLSPRLNGRLFRRIKAIDDILNVSIDDQLNQPLILDEIFYVDGITDEDMNAARTNFNNYKAVMENLLQRFGIQTEIEIFSNSYSIIRKRINDREEDDFSFFNTQRVIEEEIEVIYSTHRKRLFEHHGKKFDDQVEWSYDTSRKSERESRIILRSVAYEPSIELQRLAVAYYKVAYCQENQKYLSFAWLGADILFKVRQNRIYELYQKNKSNNPKDPLSIIPDVLKFEFDPLSRRVSRHISKFIDADTEHFEDFRLCLWTNKKRLLAVDIVRAYCERHQGIALFVLFSFYLGLLHLLYFVYHWALKNNLLFDEPKRTKEELEKLEDDQIRLAYNQLTICLTFIQFGLDQFDGIRTNTKPFLEEIKVCNPSSANSEYLIDAALVNDVNLFEQHGGLGHKFMEFLEFLSTLKFAWMKRQTFMQFHFHIIFAHQQHVILHKIAEKSYYRLSFTDDFTVLPCPESHDDCSISVSDKKEVARPAVDGEAFVFELSSMAQNFLFNNERLQSIVNKTGVYDLAVRPLRNRSAMATVTGTLESVNLLRRLFSPTGYINCQLSEMMLARALSSQIFFRIAKVHPPDEAEQTEFANWICKRRQHF